MRKERVFYYCLFPTNLQNKPVVTEGGGIFSCSHFHFHPLKNGEKLTEWLN